MKKVFALTIMLFFVTDSFADDWRMRKFDLNQDDLVSVDELIASGCSVSLSLFDYADKDDNGLLDKRQARRSSEYIFRKRCPKIVKPIGVRG